MKEVLDYSEALEWYAKGVFDHLGLTITYEQIEAKFQQYKPELAEVIETTYVTNDSLVLRLPQAGYVRIGSADVGFFEKLRALSVPDKIELMQLSTDDLLTYIQTQRNIKVHRLQQIMKQKWVDKIEDDPIDWEDDTLNNIRFNLPYTGKKLLAHFKAGRLKIEFIDDIFRWVNDECKLVE